MGLLKKFPISPFEIIEPDLRWFPEDEELEDKLAMRINYFTS